MFGGVLSKSKAAGQLWSSGKDILVQKIKRGYSSLSNHADQMVIAVYATLAHVPICSAISSRIHGQPVGEQTGQEDVSSSAVP
ncbi:unnamed protein product [Protopolystoma xenopodis]|uniref:Uncharacterized protein n=1 Tax=Protopolystoma xenopodis TaxID=117903 RepID=A0A448WE07_9PLAT|nr:unnamed protein product [Protopolystoma xenopodis]